MQPPFSPPPKHITPSVFGLLSFRWTHHPPRCFKAEGRKVCPPEQFHPSSAHLPPTSLSGKCILVSHCSHANPTRASWVVPPWVGLDFLWLEGWRDGTLSWWACTCSQAEPLMGLTLKPGNPRDAQVCRKGAHMLGTRPGALGARRN